ncbi:hypothetical protein SAMN05216464_113128 [Mucilaginibacter pineti]|uniref:Mobilisation protein (MobC) n=1 Tax=Mucilaginibacter pineti TaxID=1391627 RepID=A0A1G7IQX0_9SPHI|nr:hypothetical protein [Mucilaginibacter pineti]SDF15087.1 hypothetical protein SAMN05216464_113128 [Mucilaginibacter pineti]
MKDVKDIRSRWLHIRISENELELLEKQFAKTAGYKRTAYCRKMLLAQPLIGKTRDLSFEKLVEEFSVLIRELHGIAANFNQAVHKLHILDRIQQYQEWVLKYEMDKRKLLKDVEAIRKYINETSALWLQS